MAPHPVPSNPAHPAGMPSDQWRACTAILDAVYGAKAGSRKISRIFQSLPDKDDFPDYYAAIPEPECLDNIAAQLESQAYATPEQFFKQLHLVFLNAKHYNEEGSQIYADATRLENQIHQDWVFAASSHTFSHTDPYHSSPVKPGRRPKRTSVTPAKSVTPAPSIPPVLLQTLSPIPEPSAVAGSSRSPAFASLPNPPQSAQPSPRPALSSMSQPQTLQQAYTATPNVPMDPAKAAQYAADQAVVAARDATLPRWSGPKEVLSGNPAPGGVPGSGWWGEDAPDYERTTGGPDQWPFRIRAVVGAIEGYKDASGQRLAEVLDVLPEAPSNPYLSYEYPLSFAKIAATADAARYLTLKDFDMDMARLFEKARRWYHDGSPEYGQTLVLQRLYNALTAPYPIPLPPSGVPAPSVTQFASIPAGPGNARSLHEATQEMRAGASEDQVGYAITTFRVGTKDRVFTDEARHKGVPYRVGDYVHLINPDDPTRPIVGQIFKTFVPTKGQQTHHASVCWYYRPEQTVHQPDTMFYEREVFKTGQFCDHPVEDILERISVQFYVKYIRGRPREGEYYPGWPTCKYVCNSRFNHRDYNIVRIKNWNSCIPEELRQTDFMSIVPFERPIELRMLPSPFNLGVRGPGFFGDPKKILGGDIANDDDDDEEERPKRGRGRPPATPAATSYGGSGSARGTPVPQTYRAPVVSQQGHVPAPAPPVQAPPPPKPVVQPVKTFAGLLGGQQILDQVAHKETLPQEVAKLFPQDVRGNVLWFSGAPIAPGAISIPKQPAHSLAYLEYLTKRRRGEDWVPPKKSRKVEENGVFPNGQDAGGDGWWAEGKSGEEVRAELESIVRG
ncbi:hypothetical protein I350_04953 [Cryptococcus amylolentus CBS 6273]|uniref:BAH domain-containing protein n=1 Tax=Cryptococcus amylolentus CBS 6273 TaxID=1296118 RepID=A0A1E3K137_9TREE|nr:hypothetical protein I350_04953 [Cryptococcus amylolentus CBS 6273]